MTGSKETLKQADSQPTGVDVARASIGAEPGTARSGAPDDIFFVAVQTTRMPMCVTDPRQPDNPIIFVNKAFRDMTGYSDPELLGVNCRFLQGAGH